MRVAIVGLRFQQHRHATGPVALVGDFLDRGPFEVAGALFDGPLDVIRRHAPGLGGGDGGTQARVAADIAATHARCSRDFAYQLGEDLAALGVDLTFLSLDGCPFTMP